MTTRLVVGVTCITVAALAGIGLIIAPVEVLFIWWCATSLFALPRDHLVVVIRNCGLPVPSATATVLGSMMVLAALTGVVVLLGPLAAAGVVALAVVTVVLGWRRHRHQQPDSPAPSPVLPEESTTELATLSVEQLCTAWQRSYWLLKKIPPGTDHRDIVAARGSVLDELERRDPDGFVRWLDTEPRPVSNPRPYLQAGP